MNPRVSDRFKYLDKALKLQASAYDIHFEKLNGEAARLREMQATYIPREVHGRDMDEIKKELKTFNDWKIAQEGKSGWLRFLPWAITIFMGLLTAYKFLSHE